MSAVCRFIATAFALAGLALAGLALVASAAGADGIDPGLWKIVGQSESGGVMGPPHESVKCLTADDTRDLGATFSPVPRTVNSVCAPIERSLHHYTATVRSNAAMAGMPMGDTQDTLEGQWLSACPQ